MMRMNLSKTAGIVAKLTIGCLAATQAYAFIAEESHEGIPFKTPVTRPTLYVSDMSGFADDDSIIQHDERSNAVRLISGASLLNVQVRGATAQAFEKATLDAIAQNKAIFGIDLDEVRVNKAATLVSGPDAAVTLQVFRNGLIIQDAGITFRFKNGSLIQIKNQSFSEATPVFGSRIDTGATAAKAIGSSGYVGRGSKWRVKATDAGYSLVRIDEYVVAGREDAYVVQVDTSNGEIFELRSQRMHLRGTAVAKVFPRYFGDTAVNTALAFAAPENSNDRANERGEFQTADDFTAPALKSLIGQFVKVTAITGKNLSAEGTKVNGQWLIQFDIQPNTQKPYDNNDMAQAMAYVHLNKIIGTAKKYVSPSWFNKALTVNVNRDTYMGDDAHCNAWWDGSTINFLTAGKYKGILCSNTALIADVGYHEWGHGLDDNTGGVDDGAMSEGFGDALAMYMTDDPIIGIEFRPLDHKPVRDLTVKKVYPADVANEVHKDGLIIGGTWYDLYVGLKKKLGNTKAKEVMGKFLFKGIYEFAKMSDVYDATLALDDDNANLKDGTPNLCVINKAFEAHGLAKHDDKCDSNSVSSPRNTARPRTGRTPRTSEI